MTERLADISAHITGVEQLGAVVGAMRGIAAARVQKARGALVAVDGYTAIIAAAIGRALVLAPQDGRDTARPAHRVQILFCAEQGFAGACSEHVLATVDQKAKWFVVGSRGAAWAGEHAITPS